VNQGVLNFRFNKLSAEGGNTMNQKSNVVLAACGMLTISMLCACGPSQEELGATAVQATADEAAVLTAEAPTATPVPTDTLAPTETPLPTPTDTPEPSPTATITNTPLPTDTPEPTIPPEPTLGEIIFFDDGFEAPIEQFQLGVTKVYACFEYWNMTPDLRISGYVYRNGKDWANISQMFDLDGND
jgi:hypothetical protein